MIKLEKTEVLGWENAIRGMRNPMNSWDRSDTGWVQDTLDEDRKAIDYDYEWMTKKVIGPNDHELMMKLAAGGPVHAKYRRMIVVYVDITAPLYWWKEFDTYKVGTVANSCSTMHKIHEKEFTLSDFSHEHLMCLDDDRDLYVDMSGFGDESSIYSPIGYFNGMVDLLNKARDKYLTAKKNRADGFTLNRYWWQMIQLLPSSYNQKRTVMLNYEVLAGIYPMRKNHKLDEWVEFCKWIEKLPYSEVIIGGENEQ